MGNRASQARDASPQVRGKNLSVDEFSNVSPGRRSIDSAASKSHLRVGGKEQMCDALRAVP
jgi:hypothetical protein